MTEEKIPRHSFKTNLSSIGRPRIYDDEFLEKEAVIFTKWIDDNTNSNAIYFKEFAFERGYAPSKMCIFAERNDSFRAALEVAHEWQELKLSKGGITKEFAEGFTKFVLARNHGWVEQKNINITSANPIPAWALEAAGESKDLVNNDKPSS